MNPQAGWYADPDGDVTKLRYWDGTQWTDQYMDAPAAEDSAAKVPSAAEQVAANAAAAVEPAAVPIYQASPAGYQLYPMTETDRTLRLVAFILNILATVSVGWALLPLAWMIPMTVRSYGIYKGTKPNTVAFDVCTLIFMGIISGILLLVSRRDD